MDQHAKLAIFRAQTENVRSLDQARRQINRSINYALRKGDLKSTEVHTKVLALLFCAWVESNFSKVLHTPYGFTIDEIQQIKNSHQRFGLGIGWKKCIELGLARVSNAPKSNYIPNIKQKLSKVVDDYIVSPSLIRNKVAHGQWKTALNSDNSAVNLDITNKMRTLDVILVEEWFGVHEHLATVVESLVESPNRAFHRDYWKEIANLEQFLDERAGRNLIEKIRRLQEKPLKRL
jgi:hypothetical protein